MTSVNGGALGAYGYNGDGKRVRKVEDGATTYYVNSAVLGSAAFELNGSGTVNRVHVTAGGKEVAQLATDNSFYWLHTDHLGTPRRVTNSTDVVMFRGEYDPHGNPLLEWTTISNGKFTGYERDAAAGLDFAQARHYKFGRGRFIQPDPITGFSLRRLNRYSYANNDPINFVDLNGLEPTPVWVPGIGWVYGAVFSNSSVNIYGSPNRGSSSGAGNGADQIEIELSGGDGGGVGGDYVDPILDMWQRALQNTTRRTRAILDANGKCAKFFGPNAKAALDGLLNSDFEIKSDGPGNVKTGIKMNVNPATQVDINRGYRLPVTDRDVAAVTVYTNGPVFMTPGASGLGGHAAGTDGAQMTAILHELAHLVINQNTNTFLIPNDGANGELSSQNTNTMMKECGDEIFKMIGK